MAIRDSLSVISHVVTPRFLCAEFMYRPRPDDPRARAVFDFCFASRLAQLDERDRLLLICNSDATAASLRPLIASVIGSGVAARRSSPDVETQIVNPAEQPGDSVHDQDTPRELAWESPGAWRRMTMTDRWARLLAALRAGAQIGADGWLILPAHDAVWGGGLLDQLVRLSRKFARKGIPAAVSPVTYWQHSPVPGAEIPTAMIDLLNTALSRDACFWWKITTDQVQAVWGKMSLIPTAMCAALIDAVDTSTLEDDLILDSAIRRLGYGSRAVWIEQPRRYRQALPVFSETDARQVIARTLHYSLNASSSRSPVGASTLNLPLDGWGRLRARIAPRYRRWNGRAEQFIREEAAAIEARIDEIGASWLDWGAYRIVVRIGDVACEVWKRAPTLL